MKIWQKKGTKVRDHIDQFTVGDDRYWDLRLAPYDIIASKAHAKMLGKVGLLSQSSITFISLWPLDTTLIAQFVSGFKPSHKI